MPHDGLTVSAEGVCNARAYYTITAATGTDSPALPSRRSLLYTDVGAYSLQLSEPALYRCRILLSPAVGAYSLQLSDTALSSCRILLSPAFDTLPQLVEMVKGGSGGGQQTLRSSAAECSRSLGGWMKQYSYLSLRQAGVFKPPPPLTRLLGHIATRVKRH